MLDTLRELKQYCLNIYIKSKDNNIRKVMRKIDKYIEKELKNGTNDNSSRIK